MVLPISTGGGGACIEDTATVFGVTGNNAIVDWIFIEIRDQNDPTQIVATRSALLQRDGDIVDIDGYSLLQIPSIRLFTDSAYIAIRYRNHFGVRTNSPVALSGCGGTLIDFSDPAFTVYGSNARVQLGTIMALIAGDANRDGQINAVDKNTYWRVQNGQPFQYLNSSADFNLDGAVNAVDKNNYWRVNNSKTEQLD